MSETMTKIDFKVIVMAPKATVWFAMWNDFHYRNWTSAFCEGSYAVSDWKEGSTVHFLMPGGNGMYSKISKMVENEKMFFSHIGELKNFKEQPIDEKTKGWSGATENYSLEEKDGITTVTASIDLMEDHLDFMKKAFPSGFSKLKSAAEDLWIVVQTTVNAPIGKTWQKWITPSDIMVWNAAHESWFCPKATNDLREGGKFSSTMSARDGSVSFDFGGTYDKVVPNQLISYVLEDGRAVKVEFSEKDGKTTVCESFRPEGENSLALQYGGWQAILDHFKKHVEKG